MEYGQMKLRAFLVSHCGLVREQNEDNFYLDGAINGIGVSQPIHMQSGLEAGALACVFDGMGGESCGELASLIAAQTFAQGAEELAAQPDEQMLATLFARANGAICRHADENGIPYMGTTAVALLARRRDVLTANAGDSRCYLLRDGLLLQLSTDHTGLQEMIEHGMIEPEEADVSRKYPLTRHLGAREAGMAQPSFCAARIKRGDVFLLCSDGLTDMVGEEEIATVLDEEEIEQAARILLERALENGGRDNITMILLQAE